MKDGGCEGTVSPWSARGGRSGRCMRTRPGPAVPSPHPSFLIQDSCTSVRCTHGPCPSRHTEACRHVQAAVQRDRPHHRRQSGCWSLARALCGSQRRQMHLGGGGQGGTGAGASKAAAGEPWRSPLPPPPLGVQSIPAQLPASSRSGSALGRLQTSRSTSRAASRPAACRRSPLRRHRLHRLHTDCREVQGRGLPRLRDADLRPGGQQGRAGAGGKGGAGGARGSPPSPRSPGWELQAPAGTCRLLTRTQPATRPSPALPSMCLPAGPGGEASGQRHHCGHYECRHAGGCSGRRHAHQRPTPRPHLSSSALLYYLPPGLPLPPAGVFAGGEDDALKGGLRAGQSGQAGGACGSLASGRQSTTHPHS